MKHLILTLSLAIVSAQPADSLYILGNRYYEAEDYRKAVETYEKLSTLVYHENLFHNLGNAYYKTGELGNAIWAYEKGSALAPRNSDLNFNLNFVRSQVRDRIIPPDDFLLLAIYRSVVKKLTLEDLITLTGLFLLGLAVLYVLKENKIISNKIGSIMSITVLVILILVGSVVLDKYWKLSSQNQAIVIAPTVDVRSAPIERGENVVFRIHEGTKLDIKNTQAGWYEIILLDGKKGWLVSDRVRTL